MTDLRLSNSEATTFRRCKRRWYLSHYRRLGPVTQNFNKPLGIGTRVHDTLAVMYDPTMVDVDPLEYLVGGIEADVINHPVYEVDIRKEGELSTIMLEGYLQWLEETGADQDLEIIAPEDAVEIPLFEENGNTVSLLSKLDVRVQKESDQSRWALEHKTVGNLTEPVATLQIDTQLLTEHLVEFMKLREEGNEDQVADGILYNMLRKVKRTRAAKPPFYGREEVRHNRNELRNHWTHVVAIAREILEAHKRLNAGESHQSVCYPSPDKTCTWQCQFFKVCPLADDGSDFEGALVDMYSRIDPLERYEPYFARQLEKQKEQLSG